MESSLPPEMLGLIDKYLSQKPELSVIIVYRNRNYELKIDVLVNKITEIKIHHTLGWIIRPKLTYIQNVIKASIYAFDVHAICDEISEKYWKHDFTKEPVFEYRIKI